MENNKQIQKLLKGAECALVSTDKGIGVVGNASTVLVMYTLLTKNLAENLPKELIEDAFEKAFMNEKELLKELKDKLDELMKKMEE